MQIKKKIKKFLSDESGLMVTTEAIILYPYTIIVIFAMIYIGLVIFQGVALQNYAQKIAVIAAREVAYPGYIDLMGTTDDTSTAVSIFGTNAIDWEDGCTITVGNNAETKQVNAYRYLFNIGQNSDILSSQQKSKLTAAATSMVENYSLLAGDGVQIEINATNYFISQQVDVTITENLRILGFVEALGFKGDTLSATATATANDPDEFIRNVDLVFGVGEELAAKLGINTNKFSDVIKKIKDVLKEFNMV